MKNAGTAPSPAHTTLPDASAFHLLRETPCSFSLTPEEMQAVITSIPIKTVKKGTYLLREGQMATMCYYIFKGCVREFYLMDGEEKTTEFYTEEDSLTAAVSRIQGKPAKQYWECVEDTTLSVSSYEKEKELYRRFPRFESHYRIELEEKFGMYRERMAIYMTSTPEERYLNLLKHRADLLDRVPQYQLASYIGVKPESLSRIRGRLIKYHR